MTNDNIPILNLKQFSQNKKSFVNALGDAYCEFGFCGITHHGIPDDLISSAFSASHDFFMLPFEVKHFYTLPHTGGARGYTQFGTETAKSSQYPDLKEFWHVGRELVNNPYPHILIPNVWPKEISHLKHSLYPLYTAFDYMGTQLLRAIALYLDLDEHYFDKKVHYSNSILRAIHYPPMTEHYPNSVRASAHEDINLITLLVGSQQPGLEILTRDQRWIPIRTIPETIIVNIGDMLQQLTNNILRSTTHRVVNPQGEHAAQPRFSIPFFLYFNHDVVIETLPQCVTPNRPNIYPQPILSHDYLTERLRQIHLLDTPCSNGQPHTALP